MQRSLEYTALDHKDGFNNIMKRTVSRFSLLVFAGFSLSCVAEIHPSNAGTLSSTPELTAHIILASSADVLPSQRPCYLSSQSGPTASRFNRQTDGSENPWGLGPVPAGTGLVVMKPGETCATARNSDLGSLAAGATVE